MVVEGVEAGVGVTEVVMVTIGGVDVEGGVAGCGCYRGCHGSDEISEGR